MTCRRVQEWNGAVVLGEATPPPPEDVAAHLATCSSCRSEVQGARWAWSELDELEEPTGVAINGQLSGGGAMSGSFSIRAMAASVVLALAVGVMGGRAIADSGGDIEAAGGDTDRVSVAPTPVATDAHEDQFLLLIRETAATLRIEEEVGTDALVSEYGAWAGTLARDGRLVAAEKLTTQGTAVETGTETAVDGTAVGAVSGYFVVRAPDYDAALQIARQSPHVRYGGVVEVRPVEVTGGAG